MELSTNQILGGLALTIAVANFAAAGWLVHNIRERIRIRQKSHDVGYLKLIISRDGLRIPMGFAIKAVAIGTVFALRLPLRVYREANDVVAGSDWLDKTVYWQTACAVLILIGLALIMWPAFTKWAPLKISLTVAGVLAFTVFAAGAIGVGVAARLI